MIARLTSAALHNRGTVVALTVAFLLLGANAFRKLPFEAFPDVTNVTVPAGEVYRPTLRAKGGFPREELRTAEDWIVEKKMRTVEGILLVLLVAILFLGLGNYQFALVVGLAALIALLGAPMLLDFSATRVNLIAMGAVDFGIVIDSSALILESLLRILQERKGRIRSVKASIIKAAQKMGRPILFSKIILLTALIPLYGLRRLEGRIFKPMALMLAFALVAGTVSALVVVPVLASFAMRGGVPRGESWIARRLIRIYRAGLDLAFKAPVGIYLGAALLLSGGGFVYTHLGGEFPPKRNEGELWARTFTRSLSPGYRMEWTGSAEKENGYEKRLAILVPVTILAIYFLLFIAFDSGKFAALILLNVPYSAAGGLMAWPLAGLNVSVAALVGFVVLFGVSVQNSIILVSRIRELRREGKELNAAVKEGAASRVRAMVMTALMAIVGLLPLALATGVGAETVRPFAVVIIGGIVTDTVLTLFVLPLLYRFFESEEDRYMHSLNLVEHRRH